MKQLNITFKFEIPEDSSITEADELAYYMIEQVWDQLYEMNYIIKDYTINKELIKFDYPE